MRYRYLYGPLPSRRLGRSLGISPIPGFYCNYSCIYCYVGRMHITNKRENFYPAEEIVAEVVDLIDHISEDAFDVISIVGDGEPTLYLELQRLIILLKEITSKPIAVITNGALLSDEDVRAALLKADIVLPSLDAYTEEMFKTINRPHGSIRIDEVIEGLRKFSKQFDGELWIETMIIRDINDDRESIHRFKEILDTIDYTRLYINSPIRPVTEYGVEVAPAKALEYAKEVLGGILI